MAAAVQFAAALAGRKYIDDCAEPRNTVSIYCLPRLFGHRQPRDRREWASLYDNPRESRLARHEESWMQKPTVLLVHETSDPVAPISALQTS